MDVLDSVVVVASAGCAVLCLPYLVTFLRVLRSICCVVVRICYLHACRSSLLSLLCVLGVLFIHWLF